MIRFLIAILATAAGIIPAGDAYVLPLQKRDSILIADQIEYGFTLDSLGRDVSIALQDFSEVSNDTLTLVRNWSVDTLKTDRKTGLTTIKASIVLAPFEEGKYELPDLLVALSAPGREDTLVFSSKTIEVKTIPIDTATFEMHDIKGQMRYPVTFKELIPYIAGLVLLVALVYLAVILIRKYRIDKGLAAAPDEPSYLVALRRLEHFRDNKFWAPERQKTFYSGVTDALKFYMEDRFGIDAPEMTTAELFGALGKEKDLSADLLVSAKELFERADYVKFAKYTASDEENCTVLPIAVRFVTDTYQAELQEEQKAENVL